MIVAFCIGAKHVAVVMRWQVLSNSLLSYRCRVLLVILLLTANFISAHRHVTRGYHVTRAKSYPVNRRTEDKEDLPETNGMFFGKRSTATCSARTASRRFPPVCHRPHVSHLVL